MVRQAAAELQAAAGIQPTEQQQQQHREADSLAFEAAAAAAASQLTGLLEALGAVSERQAVERHREMVSRLRRLDQVGRGGGAGMEGVCISSLCKTCQTVNAGRMLRHGK